MPVGFNGRPNMLLAARGLRAGGDDAQGMSPGGGDVPDRPASARNGTQSGVLKFRPTVQANYGWVITGTTRNNAGAPLGLCVVDVFRTSDDVKVAAVMSDANGAFSVQTPDWGQYYLVAYLAGAPDRAGTSVNTLVASIV